LPHRIAAIFAHPDDETFCVGATIAKYADLGLETDLFCATDGDAGKNSGVAVSSREELAVIRRNEARAAAHILGIASIELAGYADGTLQQLDPAELTGSIVAFIRRRKPTIILTFGPEGAPTGHRDHRAISRAGILPVRAAHRLPGAPGAGADAAPHVATLLSRVAVSAQEPVAQTRERSADGAHRRQEVPAA
jgi:LmbE family N-acetylglucosaminyl deacetylase